MHDNPLNQSSRFEHSHVITDSLNTVIDFIRFAITEFNQHDVYFGHGTENAWQEAHRLVFTALALPLDITPEEQKMFHGCQITAPEKTQIMTWLQARCEQAIPLPYLTKQAWFAAMPFYVDERVLIPRSPFAELLTNRFSPFLPDNFEPSSILDMCTGSGCIAIALAHLFEQAQIDAIDIDPDALDVASINIEQYQLEQRVFPIQSDLFSEVNGQKYDLIVVNPPYVDEQDMHDLPLEYGHEPQSALASGVDGLSLTVALMQQAANYLTNDAWLFVEVGNSEVNFEQRFGNVSVTWCELSQGGSGIFAISKAQLDAQLPALKQVKS